MDNICFTAFFQGYGFLLRHRLDRVHVMFHRNMVDTFIGIVDEIRDRKCGIALLEITKSLNSGPSPAILPRDHTACSHSHMGGRQELNQGLDSAPFHNSSNQL